MKNPSAHRRVLIVYDGKAWYVRHVRATVHNLTTGELEYYCDEPIANGCPTLEDAAKKIHQRPSRRSSR
jgi:hypothetical protein